MFYYFKKIGSGMCNKKNVLILMLAVFAFLLLPLAVNAGVIGDIFKKVGAIALYETLGAILSLAIYFFGFLASLLMTVFVTVAKYNNFLAQEAVTIGWTIVRDLANMFVVAGILLVAVGTLLNIESYSYKKLLPKLIIGAIVINFSKMIMGFMIDISQVITLTFVHGFEDVVAGNLFQAIGIEGLLGIRVDELIQSASGDQVLALLGSLILATIVLVVTAATILVLIAYFIGRVIILWVAIVLSPLLFVLPFVPSGDKFASQVWSMISKQLFSGPLVTFFLWLSFTIMGMITSEGQSLLAPGVPVDRATEFSMLLTRFATTTGVLNFIVVIGLLWTSLMMAQQLGAVGGKLAGNLAGKIQGAGKWLAKTPSLAAGRKLDKWSIAAQKRMGIDKPVSLRPSIIKSSWESSRKRKEEAFYKGMGVAGGMEDKFNRVLSLGKDKTFEAEVERGSYKNSEKKRISEAGVESDIMLNRLDGVIKYDKDGNPVAVRGQESAAQGIAEIMMANHDINEVLLDPKLNKGALKKNNGVIKEGPEALEAWIKSVFRNESEERQAMIYEDMAAIGLANKDPHYYGRVSRNRDTGKAEWVKVDPKDEGDREMITGMQAKGQIGNGSWEELSDADKAKVKNKKHAGIAAKYLAKKEDQAIARELVPQNILRQTFDAKTGERGWDKHLDDFGKENLKVAASAIIGQWGRTKDETRKALRENIGAIAEYARSTEIDDEATRANLYKVLDTIMGTDRVKGGEGGGFGEREAVEERLKNFSPGEGGQKNHQTEIARKERIVQASGERESELILERKKVEEEEKKYEDIKGNLQPEVAEKTREEIKTKKERIINELAMVRAGGQTAQQEIYAVHQPAAAQQLAEQLNSESFGVAPEAVAEIAKNINDSIEKALTAAAGAEKPDFSGLFKELGNNLDKLKGTLKSEKQNEIFDFTRDIDKVQGPDLQKKLLGQIKLLTRSMMQASNRAPATKK
ncbi:MAG TPA: hypothetical protein PLR18_02190 [bacterium]|nr:hypothetical protein [bacterium]